MKLSYPIKAHNDSANYSSMNFYFINRNEVLNLTKVQKLWEKSCKYIHNSSIDDLIIKHNIFGVKFYFKMVFYFLIVII